MSQCISPINLAAISKSSCAFECSPVNSLTNSQPMATRRVIQAPCKSCRIDSPLQDSRPASLPPTPTSRHTRMKLQFEKLKNKNGYLKHHNHLWRESENLSGIQAEFLIIIEHGIHRFNPNRVDWSIKHNPIHHIILFKVN